MPNSGTSEWRQRITTNRGDCRSDNLLRMIDEIVSITDKLKSYAAANRDPGLNMERRQDKGLSTRAENSHQPTRVREKVMRPFKSARHLQRFAPVHDQVANLFMHCRYNPKAQQKRQARTLAFEAWETVTGHSILDHLAA
uniref:hypothetical protein n=1 Tax=Paraburkholderia elongata TaxID=2675747 RepID=UPI0038B32E6D